MKYKQVNDGYIIIIGVDCGGIEISDDEYNDIMAIIHNKPQETDTIGYRLKTDLTWEQYEKEPQPEPDLDDSELIDILLGAAE